MSAGDDDAALRVGSPVPGTVVAMTEVGDPVFAESMVGPGLAVQPAGGYHDAVAPIDGTVATLHPHAFVIAAADGKAVLVHLGIDTVKQDGEGFTVHVSKGDTVRAGQPLVGWAPEAVVEAGYSAIVPVVALDAPARALGELATGRAVSPGDALFTWTS